MKALHFLEHGSLENLKFGEIDTPGVGADDVLIRVKACAINHLDLWVLQGWPGLDLPKPHVGGSDISGVVVECGPEVSGIDIGARVAVCPGYVDGEDEYTKRGEDSLSPNYHIFGESRAGGFAEYVSVPAKCVYEIHDNLGFSEACAPLLVGLTAWRMLKVRAQLRAGESVLIVGAGGGLNSFALQLAKALGAEVIALSSSAEKLEKAQELGADHLVNYKEHSDWSRVVRKLTGKRGVDVVVDNVGAKTFEQSIRSAARGGRIVTVGNTSGPVVQFDNRLIFTKQLSLIGSTMGSGQDFKNVMEYIQDGRVKPVIDREMPLSEGKKGYQMLEEGEQFGKIVLIPQN